MTVSSHVISDRYGLQYRVESERDTGWSFLSPILSHLCFLG